MVKSNGQNVCTGGRGSRRYGRESSGARATEISQKIGNLCLVGAGGTVGYFIAAEEGRSGNWSGDTGFLGGIAASEMEQPGEHKIGTTQNKSHHQ